MKKAIIQILILLIVISIGMMSVFITDVFADSIAGLNCPSSVSEGKTFTVALILPSNAYSAQANVTVKFSNGTTSSQNLVYVNGMSDFPNTVTFKASVAGNATVTASNIVISDANANSLETGGSKVGTVNIVGNAPANPTPAPTPTPAPNNSGSTSPQQPAQNNSGNQNAPAQNSNVSFSDVNEVVYTTDSCNVRKSYSTDSEKVTKLEKGTKLTRTGIGNNGWSRVSYNGNAVYISSQFLTKDEPKVEFKVVNEQVFAVNNCNLRKSWSTDSELAGSLTKGDEVTRTGVAENGWSRISYNGQTVYVATRLITAEPVEKENDEETEPEETETPNEELSEIDELKANIGVLPEVGNNIATTIYYITMIISIGFVIGILLYILLKKNNI